MADIKILRLAEKAKRYADMDEPCAIYVTLKFYKECLSEVELNKKHGEVVCDFVTSNRVYGIPVHIVSHPNINGLEYALNPHPKFRIVLL